MRYSSRVCKLAGRQTINRSLYNRGINVEVEISTVWKHNVELKMAGGGGQTAVQSALHKDVLSVWNLISTRSALQKCF